MDILIKLDKTLSSFSGREQFVELSSSFHSGVISMSVGLLDNKVTAANWDKTRQRLSERIIRPVLNSIAAIPPSGVNPTLNYWMNANLNWNPICWGGTVLAASIALSNKTDRALIYATAFVNGNAYLNVFTSDSWDTEGLQYWNLGFGEYIILREALLRVTKNKFDLLNDDMAKQSLRYPYESSLFIKDGLWYGPSIGDSPDDKSIMNSNLREYLDYAVGNVPQNGAIIDQPTDRPPGVVISIFSDINPVFVSRSDKYKFSSNSFRSFFDKPGTGILISRSEDGAGLSAAFKLLGNEGVHSHNDIGSYEIYLNGIKLSGDPGGVYYTANSFGAKRFDSEILNSIGHPVPYVNGAQQRVAASGKTNILKNAIKPYYESVSFTDDLDSITFDLTGAYAVGSLQSLKRNIEFCRDSDDPYVSIEDKFTFTKPSTFETALIAPYG